MTQDILLQFNIVAGCCWILLTAHRLCGCSFQAMEKVDKWEQLLRNVQHEYCKRQNKMGRQTVGIVIYSNLIPFVYHEQKVDMAEIF